jgi:hypothetical protein
MRPFLSTTSIKSFAVAVDLYVHFRIAQIVFIVLSNAFNASTVDPGDRIQFYPAGIPVTPEAVLRVHHRRGAAQRACYTNHVSPRTRSLAKSGEQGQVELPAGVRVGIEEAERGEFADMSPAETEHYLETGDLPERVARWLDSYDSRRAT